MLRRSTAAIARDDADFRPYREPSLNGRGLAMRKNVYDATPFEIADDRPITVPALPSPIIDSDDMRCRQPLSRVRAHRPQQRVLADRKQKPPREASPGPATQRETKVMDDAPQPLSAARQRHRDLVGES